MGTISFARGVPAPECLPVEELADCARAAIAQGGPAVLSYGPGGGYTPLRGWIAERYGVEPERVVLTNGSLQGFVFLAELLAPGKRVLVEAPTYDRPLRLVRPAARPGCRARSGRRLDVHLAALPHRGDGVRVPAPRQLRAEPRASSRTVARAAGRHAGRAGAGARVARAVEPSRGRVL